MLSSFKSAFVGGGITLMIAGIIGFFLEHTFAGALRGIQETSTLSVLESSMSLDNSMVAASLIIALNPTWRKRYLTWGMLIAVLGMRFLFPILIVSASAGINPYATLTMALHDPNRYGQILMGTQDYISAFGGAFLMMISLNHFMSPEKKSHWLKPIEIGLQKLGVSESIPCIFALVTTVVVSFALPGAKQLGFIISGITGVVGYMLVKDVLPVLLGDADAKAETIQKGTAGFGMFLYLEIVDASFSFDSVIGAFAITNKIYYILLGLGYGAFIVRLLTMQVVKTNEEFKYPYVENGAFLSILLLVVEIYLKIELHKDIPGLLTGGLSAALIIWSFIASLKENKRQALLEAK